MKYNRIVAGEMAFPNLIVTPNNGSWAIEPLVVTHEGVTYLQGVRVIILNPAPDEPSGSKEGLG